MNSSTTTPKNSPNWNQPSKSSSSPTKFTGKFPLPTHPMLSSLQYHNYYHSQRQSSQSQLIPSSNPSSSSTTTTFPRHEPPPPRQHLTNSPTKSHRLLTSLSHLSDNNDDHHQQQLDNTKTTINRMPTAATTTNPSKRSSSSNKIHSQSSSSNTSPEMTDEITIDIHDTSASLTRFKLYPSHHKITMAKFATSTDSRGCIPGELALCFCELRGLDQLLKCGRLQIAVYEYTIRGHPILMDQDNGMIHITGIWKACGRQKADVVRLIESQPESKVRGGYLRIQGTWLPHEIAETLSRRVAWEIRHDLVPLFGPDFPSTCLEPGSPGFGDLVLSPPKSKRGARNSEARAAAVKASHLAQNNSSREASAQAMLGKPLNDRLIHAERTAARTREENTESIDSSKEVKKRKVETSLAASLLSLRADRPTTGPLAKVVPPSPPSLPSLMKLPSSTCEDDEGMEVEDSTIVSLPSRKNSIISIASTTSETLTEEVYDSEDLEQEVRDIDERRRNLRAYYYGHLFPESFTSVDSNSFNKISIRYAPYRHGYNSGRQHHRGLTICTSTTNGNSDSTRYDYSSSSSSSSSTSSSSESSSPFSSLISACSSAAATTVPSSPTEPISSTSDSSASSSSSSDASSFEMNQNLNLRHPYCHPYYYQNHHHHINLLSPPPVILSSFSSTATSNNSPYFAQAQESFIRSSIKQTQKEHDEVQ